MDKEEKQAVDILHKLGMQRNVAKASLFFLLHDKGQSTTIEKTMNMRQPEVSISMKQLIDDQIVKPTNQKTTTKGRPKIVYVRCCTCQQLKAKLLQKIEEKIEDLKKQQQKLHLVMEKLA
jgi:predicted transcriptional regulator